MLGGTIASSLLILFMHGAGGEWDELIVLAVGLVMGAAVLLLTGRGAKGKGGKR